MAEDANKPTVLKSPCKIEWSTGGAGGVFWDWVGRHVLEVFVHELGIAWAWLDMGWEWLCIHCGIGRCR